jgi:subtilase family serine protease
VETDIYVKISNKDADGSWQHIGRVYTRPSTLTEGDPHKEAINFTIPPEAHNKRVYFKAEVDPTHEVHETNEDDNESYWQKEWYPVKGDTDLIISQAQLVGGITTVPMNSKYRFELAVRNIGTDTPLVGIRGGYYLRKPNESVFSLLGTDGTDAEELSPNRDQWEASPTTGYFPDRVGIHEVMVCTDIESSVPETDESNNCKFFSFEVVPTLTKAQLMITYAALEEGSSFKKNTRVHPIMRCKNIGDGYPTSRIRVEYRIDGKLRDNDTIEISELGPGREKEEKVKHDDLRLGDKGNRTLEVRIIVSDPSEIFPGGGTKSYSFRVK